MFITDLVYSVIAPTEVKVVLAAVILAAILDLVKNLVYLGGWRQYKRISYSVKNLQGLSLLKEM